MAINYLVGRLVLQGAVFVDIYGDTKDYAKSDRGVLATSKYGWELTKASAASLAIWYPGVIDRGIATGIGWSAIRAGHLTWAATTVVAPITAGYVIGATVGTAVAQEIWGEEGAQTALGFYSGGLLPGTEAPDLTDYQYIFKPTAPGGPVSLYDLGKKAVDNTLMGLGWLIENRPEMYRHPSPYMI